MRVQVVVATMHQKDFSKYSDMNLKTDAVFANQTIGNEKKSVNIGGKLVEMVSTDTRGVGINRNIGLMNALPLPILDGGRIVIVLIETIIRRPISKKVQEAIMSASSILLFILVIFVTFKDIIKLF